MNLNRRTFFLATTAAAAASMAKVPLLHAQTRPTLPIPAILGPDQNGEIEISAQPGVLRSAQHGTTSSYGFNGDYLGPTLRVRRGDEVKMIVNNLLSEDTTVHWHGLIIPGEMDGGPHQVIRPGETWRPTLEIDQPAATVWYHPHMYPSTAELVTKGLAGMLIIDDDESDSLGLPSQWGVDDIPIVIQDRRFGSDGEFFHTFNLAALTVGYVGDEVLVNGAHQPVARTAQGWLRLRILNGSNARSYRLQASDGRTLYVVGSDGGLLEAPVALDEITVHGGERFEVLVDARDGVPFDLVTLPVSHSPIMNLPPFNEALPIVSFDPSGAAGSGRLPDALATLPAIPSELPELSQTFTMEMNLDEEGMGALMQAGMREIMQPGGPSEDAIASLNDLIENGPRVSEETQFSANAVNGQSFAIDRNGIDVPKDTLLRWRIDEGSDRMLHPVHVHGCQFRILTLNGEQPAAHMQGWKDTVPIFAGGSADILVRFPKEAPPEAPYMLHCHILEHEDSGMMTQFTVS